MPCQLIYTLNAFTLLQAWEDHQYAEVLYRADLLLADGVGAVWAIHRLTGQKPECCAGVDLVWDLCQVCAREKQRVFLLGGAAGVAVRAAGRLQRCFPGLLIVGTQAGFWPQPEEAALIAKINQAQPDLLLVGLGQPRQEKFLEQYRQHWQVRVALGVGGSFDVIAGDLRRAPRWLQRIGLEWFFRCLQEPWRIKRVWRLPWFVWRVLQTPKKQNKGLKKHA